MSMTNAEKRKLAKKKAKERHHKKMRNIRQNLAKRRFRLDVELDGKTIPGVMRFRDVDAVNAYRETVERRRRAGEEIAPGKVYDEDTGRCVMEIPGSKPKGAAPDKITDGVKADPNVMAVTEPKDVVTGESDK